MRSLQLLLSSLVLLSASSAFAYEDTIGLTLDAGYSVVLTNPAWPTHGFAVGAAVGIGIKEAWTLTPRLVYAYHPGPPPTPPSSAPNTRGLHTGELALDLSYALDLLQFVPYLGVGAGAFVTGTPERIRFEPSVYAVIGVDYLVSRTWAVGVELRPHLLPISIGVSGVSPGYMTATVQVKMLLPR